MSFTFPEAHSMVSSTLGLTLSPTRSRRPLEVCAGIAGEGERKARAPKINLLTAPGPVVTLHNRLKTSSPTCES